MFSKPFFVMKKSKGWNELPLYKKVFIYKQFLGEFHAQFVDKIRVKDIVKKILGNKIEVAKIVRILEDANDLHEDDINPNYIIKASHGCKWNINIKVGEKYKLHELRKKLNSWNHLYNSTNEKQYSYLRPRFFIEEKIHDKYVGKNGEAIVYMCRCIYGKVVSISVKYKELRNDYDEKWNIIGDHQLPYIEKPKYFNQFIENAEQLSILFEFVRMDFYIDFEDKIYLSEYTFSPMNGLPVLSGDLEDRLSKKWI
jgi:hypothetical protein